MRRNIYQNFKVFRHCNIQKYIYAQTIKESTCNAGDPGSIPGSGRSLGEGRPLQCFCLQNAVDRGACQAVGSQRAGHTE